VTWQYTATDSTSQLQAAGSVGPRVHLGSIFSTAPVTFAFDDYSVVSPQ
jgi:hypothetical protein